MDPVGKGTAEVEIDTDLPLPVETDVERRGRLGTERGVDGVAIATAGQCAEPSPRAASTSPMSSVRPPPLLNTPPRVFGFR